MLFWHICTFSFSLRFSLPKVFITVFIKSLLLEKKLQYFSLTSYKFSVDNIIYQHIIITLSSLLNDNHHYWKKIIIIIEKWWSLFKCLELLSPVVPHLTSAVLSSNNFSGAAALKVLSFRKLHFNSISNQGMHSTDRKFHIFQTLTLEFSAFV